MAIYHLHAKVIQRSKGKNVIAASAYLRAARLHDQKEERDWDFTAKKHVIYSDMMIPNHAPAWIKSLVELHQQNPSQAAEQLWNRMEATEKRRDAQLGREIEFALPIELNEAQSIQLAREFIQDQCVSRGMIADWSVHWDQGNPHVHVLLTMRSLTDSGFGLRVREWDSKALLQTWREKWAEYANFHLYCHQHAVRIDHRSYAEQGIDLIPGVHEGKAAREMARRGVGIQRLMDADHIRGLNLARLSENAEILFRHLASFSDTFTHQKMAQTLGRYLPHQRDAADRHAQQIKIESILQQIAQHDSVFTEKDIAKAVKSCTSQADELAKILIQIKNSAEIIALGAGDDGCDRFTTRQLFAVENDIQRLADDLQGRVHLKISDQQTKAILSSHQQKTGSTLTDEQKMAVSHLLKPTAISCVVGRAGTGKSFCLGVAKSVWEAQGLNIHGIALSGIAADGLCKDVGIPSTTIESFRYRVEKGLVTLNPLDVVVMDEAGMTDSLSMLSVLKMVQQAKAKLVLVGDPAQLQPVGPGATFRALVERLGFVEIQTVYRQSIPWQREATVDFSSGDIAKGLAAYQAAHCVHIEDDSDAAMTKLVTDWKNLAQAQGNLNQVLVIAHRNQDVNALNSLLRNERIKTGKISAGYTIQTARGEMQIAEGDRIIFLKNDRKLGVSNGRFATVASIDFTASDQVNCFTVKLDGSDKIVTINPYQYAKFTYGYAATVHKAQGITVNHSLVYAGGFGWNRHLTYVALSRHRQGCQLYADRITYPDDNRLIRRLGRLGLKDSVLDFPLAFAERRGIDHQKCDRHWIPRLSACLLEYKNRLAEQIEYWLRPNLVLERQATATRRQQEAEPIRERREDAKVVASYVDAHREVGITWKALQTKLNTLGFSKLHDNQSFAVIKKTAEYQVFQAAQDVRNRKAREILQAPKRYEKALTIYHVSLERLKKQANWHRSDKTVSSSSQQQAIPYQRIDIKRLRAALNDRAESVVTHYLGQPKIKQGNTWRYGSNQGSLVVTIQGAKQGLWRDFQWDKGGDMFGLMQHTLRTSDFKAVLQEATRFLGGESCYQVLTSVKSAISVNQTADGDEDAQQRIQKAQMIYQGTQAIAGTVAARYCREHRGILSALEDKTFRYHPHLQNWMTGSFHPALVVVARDKADEVCGIQAIFLDAKTAKKATQLGNYVKLSRGLMGEGAIVHQGKPDGKIALTEGPETALSIAQAQPDWTVVVSFGVSNFAKVRLPDGAKSVVICADNDGRDSATSKSVAKSAERLSQSGVDVWIAAPQKPSDKTKWDFNDALIAGGVEQIKNDLDRATLHQKGISKEHVNVAPEKTLANLAESTNVVKSPAFDKTVVTTDIKNESLKTLLLRYVDMELEQTRLVNAMHSVRLQDPKAGKVASSQALAHAGAIQGFAGEVVQNSDIQEILATKQKIKSPHLADRGGFMGIRERLLQGKWLDEDIHVLAKQLRNKAASETRGRVRERSRDGRSR